MEPASAIGLDVKKASSEQANFSKHASALVAMLTGLKCLVEEVEQTDPWFMTLKGLDVKGGVLSLLREEMGELASKLDAVAKGGLKGKLIWKWDKNEMHGLMGRIERCKGIVSVALLGDHSDHFDERWSEVGGLTALHQAATLLLDDTVHVLLQVGAKVESRDSLGNTPLYKVATAFRCTGFTTSHRWRSRAERIIDFLLASGADINTRCGEKQATVLHHAAWLGDVTMVRYLLSKGARTYVTDKEGRTALDWAKDNKREAMIYLLTR
ncbi:ankyrin repeat-containing domain protein [Apiosordaria backusii]|uniref:Ankyrin repeat-containing domain protein n=1 Tax=Apiosordaria backusii TaxID=314023 RepID=A0AA40DHM8_9PEZI|nr:ankyrin repeat-containing domain protein [Apiosordaria backusii]